MARAKQKKPQSVKKHPDKWEKDLNPTHMQGQNLGPQNLEDLNPRTAADDKKLTRRLQNFEDDELQQIPLVPTGGRLEQGAVYLDLRNPMTGPLVATGDMVAQPRNLYTPKSEVPYEYWNRLIAEFCPDSEASSGQGQAKQEAPVPEQLIDQTLADSFPASDPPSWTTGREHASVSKRPSARGAQKTGRKKSR